ncbi:NucA/NucB deoxyribonuclease domain-containing protein [Streptomyces capoamus]|uniref:NucA/NucB deoxyribonuclease domain-containing protein n=1 Tax=Streptomyces capoamus TaxID=68183 RepID=UPI003C2AF6A5
MRNGGDLSSHFADCDEFPFAATKESGGQFVKNGDECVRLYAQKSTDSKWRLYSDER